jgi:hypothetical protein
MGDAGLDATYAPATHAAGTFGGGREIAHRSLVDHLEEENRSLSKAVIELSLGTPLL